MNAAGKMMGDNLAVGGLAVTGAATTAKLLDVVAGVSDLLLTWVGIAAGIASFTWYVLKIIEHRKQKREQDAATKREFESKAGNV
jgi:hypothetical protein